MSKAVVLVSHFGLAKGMKTAAEFILGSQENFHAIELDSDGISLFKERIHELNETIKASEIILLSDIPSGSPGTTSFSELSQLAEGEVSLISGMNLPLVIEILLMREAKETPALLAEAIESSQQSLVNFGLTLAEDDSEDDF